MMQYLKQVWTLIFTAMYFSTKQLRVIKLSREKHILPRRTCSAYVWKSIVVLIILRSFLKYCRDIGILVSKRWIPFMIITISVSIAHKIRTRYFFRYPSLKLYHSPAQMLPLIFRWGLVSMGDRCQKAWSEIWILTEVLARFYFHRLVYDCFNQQKDGYILIQLIYQFFVYWELGIGKYCFTSECI